MNTKVERSKILDFIANTLGAGYAVANDVSAVNLYPDGISITYYCRNDENKVYVVGDEIATTTTWIAITKGKSYNKMRKGHFKQC